MTVQEARLPGRSDAGRATFARSASARNLELLRELVRRDLRARYRGSTLGIAWSLLNPLVYMVVYTVVFSKFMRFNIPGTPYPVYLLSGLLAWNFFGQAVSVSVNSVLGNASLVKKVAFPWVLLTLSAVIAAFINYLISLALLLPMVLFFHIQLGLSLVVLPVIVLMTFCFALGIGLVVAAGNVYFRDIEYLVGIALQVWFFATPIIYQLDQITQRADVTKSSLGLYFRVALYANPMTWMATSFQDVLAFHRWPVHWGWLGYAALFSVAALAIGILVFHRLETHFAEEL